MDKSEKLDQIAGPLARAQAALRPLVAKHEAKIKPRDKPEYSYTYADLSDALDACLVPFNTNEIAVIQEATTPENGVEVTTLLLHSSGQWLESKPLFMPVSGGAQAVGSAITYARRYQLLGMVGLAPKDDDGAEANANAPKTWERQAPPKRSDAPASNGKPSAAENLAKLREAVEERVERLRVLKELGTTRQAWAEACSAAGYDDPLGNGKGPFGCGFEPLGKIDRALKKELGDE